VRRTVLLVGAWLLVGAAAVGATTVAVRMVGDQVTGSRPAPLSATQVREELAARVTTSTTTTTGGDPTTSAPTTTPTPTTTTTSPPPSTGAPTTTARPSAAEVRTYQLVGGTASLRFSAAGVVVVSATPAAGFDVEVEPEHGNGVQVEFESEGHRSRVDGWWADGPQDEVREQPD
jgi:hypothetical protein